MPDDVWFLPAIRRGGAPAKSQNGRPVLERSFTVHTSNGAQTVTMRAALTGPRDVTGMRQGAIVRMVPTPGRQDAERDERPFVELAEADLPWRYSPGLDSAGRLRPWLAVVVGPVDEITIAAGRATLSTEIVAAHPLERAALWAHVQQEPPGSPPARQVARVVACRHFGDQDRRLLADTDHVAALVLPWTDQGEPAWDSSAPAEALVDCYASWTFRTGPSRTFADLADELHPADDDPVGTVQVDLEDGPTMVVAGALTCGPPLGPPTPEVVRTDLSPPPIDDRQVVGPAAYGAPWTDAAELTARVSGADVTAAPTWSWAEQVNADMRRRVVAALGRQAAVDLQEEIVGSAGRAWGAGSAAASVLGGLALGLAASAGMFRRVPDDPGAALALLGPVTGRIAAAGPGEGVGPSLRQVVADPAADPLLGPKGREGYPESLLGPRLRRAVSGTIARHSAPNATDPSVLLRAAVRVDTGPDRPREALDAGTDPADLDPSHADTALHDYGHPVEALPDLHPGPPPEPRVTLDLDELAAVLRRRLDPGGAEPPARGRVRRRLRGVPPNRELLPLEDCPDLDLPAWRYLREHAPHWLLPGAETLSEGEVVALRTDPGFIEAFLLGMSQQALAELRWRQHPVRPGCTPLRRFWDRLPGPDRDGRTDIQPVAEWTSTSGDPTGPLGTHPGDGVIPERLVVVIRSELFRRYPSTTVTLAPDGVTRPAQLGERELPQFVAALSPSLTMFAFPTNPAEAPRRWVVVEEVPELIRFATDEAKLSVAHPISGATTAADLLMQPTRVLHQGAAIIPAGAP